MSGIAQRIARRYPLDFGGREEDAILVAGVGRSGTTWLADLINYESTYRDLFEPFHAWMVPEAEVLKGHWYQRSGDEPPRPFIEYVDGVVRGRIRHPWIDRFNRRVIARRRIIKSIRASLFLGWLATRYPRLKIIHLIRHPAAVAQSRLRLHEGWQWRPTLAEMLAEARLRGQLSHRQIELCGAAETPFQEHVVTWCISTRTVLEDVPEERAATVYYEGLLKDLEEQLKPVFRYLERDWDPRCLDMRHVASKTARSRAVGTDLEPAAVAGWMTRMDSADRNWLDRALELFGLGHLYGTDGYPVVPGGGLAT